MAFTIVDGYERGAERLRARLKAACEPGAGFAEQIETALRTALALFAAEPELGRLLTIRPFAGEEEAIDCYLRWQAYGGEVLRAAAARDPAAHVHPSFVEPALIAGICWRISQHLQAEEAERLEAVLPDLLELVFVTYFGAERAGQLVRAA
ncbi:MAG TPA: hypothetical protein VGO13_00985 [Solirubrobacterales bacterium]|jgi:hypothetical protein|nr:hypothetical protein [Solirubrobacterales bacterium]